jgi:hypothetical protein
MPGEGEMQMSPRGPPELPPPITEEILQEVMHYSARPLRPSIQCKHSTPTKRVFARCFASLLRHASRIGCSSCEGRCSSPSCSRLRTCTSAHARVTLHAGWGGKSCQHMMNDDKRSRQVVWVGENSHVCVCVCSCRRRMLIPGCQLCNSFLSTPP